MFTVYVEKEIFENIVVFNNENPNWYKIFCNHSEICLNISDDDFLSEQIPGTPIFEYIHSGGGRTPIALKSYFDLIYEDNSLIADKPRSAFLLNYTKEEADSIQSSFGVIV